MAAIGLVLALQALPAGAGESTSAARDIPLAVVRQNLLDDPDLLAKVAARNGMTAARFAGQEEGRILQMVREYLAERDAAQKARVQPAQATAASGALNNPRPVR